MALKMLTIRPEIKAGERKVDGTYNIKLRFTLNRKVKKAIYKPVHKARGND